MNNQTESKTRTTSTESEFIKSRVFVLQTRDEEGELRNFTNSFGELWTYANRQFAENALAFYNEHSGDIFPAWIVELQLCQYIEVV